MKIGILREGKTPPDTRVPLTPAQCASLQKQYPELDIAIEPSPDRCYTDEEYEEAGINLSDDFSDRDVVLGVKEVPIPWLRANKTYLFFSHTIKKQPYNRDLLKAILEKKIRLIDYECLVDQKDQRVIAFGRWAGIVGAHNGLMAYGLRTGEYEFPPVHQFRDYNSLKRFYQEEAVPLMRIVVTGTGRVAHGAMEVLDHLQVQHVEPETFLELEELEEPVYTVLHVHHMYKRKSDGGFDQSEFFNNPGIYESTFAPYTHCTDLMINAIYWDPDAPRFFSREDMQRDDFAIQTIADITCDINGSIPATIRPATIESPVYGFDPKTGTETKPYRMESIDIMAVDNLPNELPRDASEDFGDMLINNVIDQLLHPPSEMIRKATIAENGQLTEEFSYLQGYVDGKE